MTRPSTAASTHFSYKPVQWSWREQGARGRLAVLFQARGAHQRMCGGTPGGDDYHALPYLATIRRLFGVTWRGVILADGVYSNNRDTRSMASGEVRARNTLMRRDFPTFPAINKIYLGPGMGFNLGEFELCVVGVHLLDLLSCWSSQHLKKYVFRS